MRKKKGRVEVSGTGKVATGKAWHDGLIGAVAGGPRRLSLCITCSYPCILFFRFISFLLRRRCEGRLGVAEIADWTIATRICPFRPPGVVSLPYPDWAMGLVVSTWAKLISGPPPPSLPYPSSSEPDVLYISLWLLEPVFSWRDFPLETGVGIRETGEVQDGSSFGRLH